MLDHTLYLDRPQTYLKHVLLWEYLMAWAQKLKTFKRKLWFVDCFAGPDEVKSPTLADSSIGIALTRLNEINAAFGIDVGAVFVELDRRKVERLVAHLGSHAGRVDVHPLHGRFEDKVDAIRRIIGRDPALILVDPHGWLGAEMSLIQALARESKQRDVIVNVMFNFMNLAQANPNDELKDQLAAFFGAPRDQFGTLDAEPMLRLYGDCLERCCGFQYHAHIHIPHAHQRRTWYGLAVGGRHPQVLKVFRDAERAVLKQSGAMRGAARAARGETAQGSLFGADALDSLDAFYVLPHERDRAQLENDVLDIVEPGVTWRYGDVWPRLLATRHVTRGDVSKVVRAMEDKKLIEIRGRPTGTTAVREDSILVRP